MAEMFLTGLQLSPESVLFRIHSPADDGRRQLTRKNSTWVCSSGTITPFFGSAQSACGILMVGPKLRPPSLDLRNDQPAKAMLVFPRVTRPGFLRQGNDMSSRLAGSS